MQRQERKPVNVPEDYVLPAQEAIRRAQCSMSAGSCPADFRLHQLATLSFTPIVRSIQRWWLRRAERHYLICADVELQRAREAQLNVAYYQKRAAMVRSEMN